MLPGCVASHCQLIDGEFTAQLASGWYALSVLGSGGLRDYALGVGRDVHLQAGRTTTEVLAPGIGGRVRLTVDVAGTQDAQRLDGFGVTLKGAAAERRLPPWLLPDGGSMRQVSNPPAGTPLTCLGLLEPGDYRLDVRAAAGTALDVPLRIVAGTTVDVRAVLQPGAPSGR